MQRPQLVARDDCRLRAVRLGHRLLRRGGDERAQFAVVARDAFQEVRRHLDGRDLSFTDEAREFGGGELGEVGARHTGYDASAKRAGENGAMSMSLAPFAICCAIALPDMSASVMPL